MITKLPTDSIGDTTVHCSYSVDGTSILERQKKLIINHDPIVTLMPPMTLFGDGGQVKKAALITAHGVMAGLINAVIAFRLDPLAQKIGALDGADVLGSLAPKVPNPDPNTGGHLPREFMDARMAMVLGEQLAGDVGTTLGTVRMSDYASAAKHIEYLGRSPAPNPSELLMKISSRTLIREAFDAVTSGEYAKKWKTAGLGGALEHIHPAENDLAWAAMSIRWKTIMDTGYFRAVPEPPPGVDRASGGRSIRVLRLAGLYIASILSIRAIGFRQAARLAALPGVRDRIKGNFDNGEEMLKFLDTAAAHPVHPWLEAVERMCAPATRGTPFAAASPTFGLEKEINGRLGLTMSHLGSKLTTFKDRIAVDFIVVEAARSARHFLDEVAAWRAVTHAAIDSANSTIGAISATPPYRFGLWGQEYPITFTDGEFADSSFVDEGTLFSSALLPAALPNHSPWIGGPKINETKDIEQWAQDYPPRLYVEPGQAELQEGWGFAKRHPRQVRPEREWQGDIDSLQVAASISNLADYLGVTEEEIKRVVIAGGEPAEAYKHLIEVKTAPKQGSVPTWIAGRAYVSDRTMRSWLTAFRDTPRGEKDVYENRGSSDVLGPDIFAYASGSYYCSVRREVLSVTDTTRPALTINATTKITAWAARLSRG
jgi:hypothetical protein